MANLNRLKVVLAEQQKTGKWLAERIGKSNCTVLCCELLSLLLVLTQRYEDFSIHTQSSKKKE